MGKRQAGAGKKSREKRGVWSQAIRTRFLRTLRRTGNARAAIRKHGHANMFYKRRRRDPDFARDWAAALAEAHARLGGRMSAFLREAPTARLDPFAEADPARLLCPSPKRKPARREHVIRRTRGGRVQIALAQEGHMTAELEAQFLGRLRATGNFRGSALAIGFQPASLHQRTEQWPAFAEACREACEAASVRLDYALVAHAHALLRRPEEREPGDDPEIPFDPDKAMRILGFLDRRRGGRTTRGRRKGPPERSFDEAVASVLAKVAAIERHRKREAERAAEEQDD